MALAGQEERARLKDIMGGRCDQDRDGCSSAGSKHDHSRQWWAHSDFRRLMLSSLLRSTRCRITCCLTILEELDVPGLFSPTSAQNKFRDICALDAIAWIWCFSTEQMSEVRYTTDV
jgi:hypothetical protein